MAGNLQNNTEFMPKIIFVHEAGVIITKEIAL